MERDEADFNGSPKMPALLEEEPDPEPAKPPVPIRTLFEGYFKELAASGAGAEAKRRWTPVFESLIKFAGHDDAARLTPEVILSWKDELLGRLQPKTIKDVYLAAVRAIFKWAVQNKKIAANPAEGVSIRMRRKPQGREKGFTDEEAKAILSAVDAYRPKHSDNPQTRESAELTAAKWWMPWLCAFTGARPAELAQLRGPDVREKDGIPYIRLTPDAGSVKAGLYRDIPVHAQLIDRGFLEFVKSKGAGPLFFREGPGTDPFKASKIVSGRMATWLRTLPEVPAEVPPQYGWRDRLKTLGRELALNQQVVDMIQGHSQKTISERYGHFSLKACKVAIDQLPWITIGAEPDSIKLPNN